MISILIVFWLIGWIILSLGYYICNIKDLKNKAITKKLHVWRAFWYGIFSWIGIIFWVILFIVGAIFEVNDWIENNLNS